MHSRLKFVTGLCDSEMNKIHMWRWIEIENYFVDFKHIIKFNVLSCKLCIASFPGPAQLSIAISTEKQERAWYLFSRE